MPLSQEVCIFSLWILHSVLYNAMCDLQGTEICIVCVKELSKRSTLFTEDCCSFPCAVLCFTKLSHITIYPTNFVHCFDVLSLLCIVIVVDGCDVFTSGFQDFFIDAGDSMIAPYACGVNLNDIGKID